ncbi:hypothetical protein Tsubulata_034734 [Turnera subulata]|uniref:Enhancer of polycomb-like protein n=1 Tax=Turnera subulata TaxID=218843 RepID=A0A9Q0GAF6_9ROSI|nr:hypothetical protein Tsubulata_034734 [Turnera subulata]
MLHLCDLHSSLQKSEFSEGLLMENNVGNSHGEEIPEKTRSLDVKSLYKPIDTGLKESQHSNLKKKKRKADDGSEEKKSDRKKSRKAVSINSFNSVKSSNGSKSLEEAYSGSGPSPSFRDQKVQSKLGRSAISLALQDGVVKVPRRKRGFVGRRKGENGVQVVKLEVLSSDKLSDTDQVGKLDDEDTSKPVEAVKVKRKKSAAKPKQNGELNSDRHSDEGEGLAAHSTVDTGNSSEKKPPDVPLLESNGGSPLKTSFRKRSRKRKDPSSGKRGAEDAGPSIGSPVKIRDDLRDDDEENLEENAARMLSSRFDPSCTAYSSNSKVSSLPFLLSSRRKFMSRGANYVSGSQSASIDAAARVLRPRKLHDEKENSRKRRHYYEVLSADLDAYWVLNRRIKVFWPLDQSWYYGLIDDYNEEGKLHHVKYDDRDEEWINLDSERFKLLLLPSEVPGKTKRKRSVTRDKCFDKEKGKLKFTKDKMKNVSTENDSLEGSCMDSEPIISWLAQSTRKVKSSSFHGSKKQKISSISSASVPQLSKELVSRHEDLDSGSKNANKSNGLTSKAEVTVVGGASCSKDSKPPIVYYRRRFRRTSNAVCHPKQNLISTSVPESERSPAALVFASQVLEESDVSLARAGPLEALESLDRIEDLWSADNEGLLRVNSSVVEPRRFTFELSVPVHSVLSYSSDAVNIWLLRAVCLLRYGVLMTTWPTVQLEMLFIDSMVGLRFLLFEGCLKEAVAFVFMVLTVFRQSNDQGKFADFQLPVTSIRFKFSCIQDFKKQLVFSFYNFSEVDNSKWMYLDCKLKKHCSEIAQLPLSECTYDNIKAIQGGKNWLLSPSVLKNSTPIKGPRDRSRHCISLMGGSREPSYVNATSPSSKCDMYHKCLPPFVLSFTAAPTFFLGLHLKLLLERSVSCVGFRDHNLGEQPESSGSLLATDCSNVEDCSSKGLENAVRASSVGNYCDGTLSFAKPVAQAVDVSGCSLRDATTSPKERYGDADLRNSASSKDLEKVASNATDMLQKQKASPSEPGQCHLLPRSPINTEKCSNGSQTPLNGITVEIPSSIEKHSGKESHGVQPSTDLSWNMNGGIIPSPNPTARRSTWNRSRNSSASFGYLVHRWSDDKADFLQNNFGNQPKKPRTQVSYASPFGRVDYSSRNKSNQQRILPDRRIRSVNEKRYSDITTASERSTEVMSCDANVLITQSDRGWRECGVQVVLELFEHNEWKLAVKISGIMKYSYKAHQFLQPGSTNRYTHAMMWKGGKDWTLEFPDRSQWAVFKVMHEECYNRNIRAALVKNIPIPGVHLIEEIDDHGIELPFVRGSSKYFRQVETDVEMALNPSRVLYDMDSDDEEWLSKNHSASEVENVRLWEISEEMFERTMDMFEKASYTQQRVQFTPDEVEELMAGFGPMEAIKSIHEYWEQKRQKKGMPLIRHLQPPLWERYQQQVKEWEQAMKSNPALLNGCHEKFPHAEKPPMFAFCLKPRGLEVPNKGSKQRSQKKFSVSGQANALSGDHDGYHAYGRRLNGLSNGDEKGGYPGYNCEPLDDSPLPLMSPRVFSQLDTGGMGYFSTNGDRYDRNHIHKFHTSKSKRLGMSVSPNGTRMGASYSQKMFEQRNGNRRWNMAFSDWPSQRQQHLDWSMRHGPERLDDSDLDEFRYLDASGVAKHARTVAKRKREDAQKLLCRADVAIHRAVVALMTAEAMRASSEDLNGDG